MNAGHLFANVLLCRRHDSPILLTTPERRSNGVDLTNRMGRRRPRQMTNSRSYVAACGIVIAMETTAIRPRNTPPIAVAEVMTSLNTEESLPRPAATVGVVGSCGRRESLGPLD